MTDVAIIKSQVDDSNEAGEDIAQKINERFDSPPDAVIIFASPVYSAPDLLSGLDACCTPSVLAGCSSAGEFTYAGALESSVVALALRSDDLRFKVHAQGGIESDVRGSAGEFAESFDPGEDPEFPFTTLLLLMDVLAGYGESFLEAFTEATDGRYQVFGGGAADDAAFEETFVFAGKNVMSDAAVGLEISSKQPLSIGVSHGWTPYSRPMTVTGSAGLQLDELDGHPAAEVIEIFANERGRDFDRAAPLPFFLHHVLGIETDEGYKLRVPLAVNEDGSLVCAAEVPEGATIRVMRTSNTSSCAAAGTATRRARAKMLREGIQPGAALFFDCAATRLRLGDEFGKSVDEVMRSLDSGASCVGCNTHGQFARVKGQFSGFHNCTAVVCLLPQ